MGALAISWRELAAPVIIFVVLVGLFVGLSATAGWPNASDGWPAVVTIAAAVAFAPLVARGISFLQQSRASVEGPFGLKLNFASAVARSETKVNLLAIGTVQQGTILPESGSGELERAAVEANKHEEVVIDVEDGSAWYLTRIFAFAATADFLGSPKLLILIGQKGGQIKQAGGSITPRDLVRAMVQKDPRFGKILRHVQVYMEQLRAPMSPNNVNAPPLYSRLHQYTNLYEEVGEPIFMRILVEQLVNSDPGVVGPTNHSMEAQPPWVTLAELQQWLSPWLGSDFVDMAAPPKEQISTILASKGDIALAVRNGTFEGIIDVKRAARHILSQLAERAEA